MDEASSAWLPVVARSRVAKAPTQLSAGGRRFGLQRAAPAMCTEGEGEGVRERKESLGRGRGSQQPPSFVDQPRAPRRRLDTSLPTTWRPVLGQVIV